MGDRVEGMLRVVISHITGQIIETIATGDDTRGISESSRGSLDVVVDVLNVLDGYNGLGRGETKEEEEDDEKEEDWGSHLDF